MKKTYFTVTLFFLFLIWLEFLLLSPNENSVNEYYALLDKCYESKEDKEPFAAVQKKVGVYKDIFFDKDRQKHQMRIFSDSCEFVYQQSSEGKEIIEKHKNVNCLIQENFLFDKEKNEIMQVIKLIKADEATYSISQDKLLAQNAEIRQYKVKGNNLPESFNFEGELVMKGHVGNIEVEFNDKEITLNADTIHGNILQEKI